MEDQQRVRLIILAISGVLFGAGAYGYFWYQDQKQASQFEEAPITVRPTVKPASTVQLASNTGTTTGATVPAVNIAPATQTGTVTPPGQQPVVATQPTGTTPTTTPPTTTAATTPTATATQPPVQPAQVKTPTQLPPTVKPATQVATAPATTPTKTPTTTPAPATTTPATTAAATNPVVPVAPVVGATPTPSVAVPAGQYPATITANAAIEAKQKAGRPDPAEPQFAFLPFPRNVAGQQTPPVEALAALPPPQKPAPTKINEKLVPPPPPTEAMPGLPGPNAVAGGLPIDQLPVPPSRPTIGDKMRVLGLFDDKAIIAFPKGMATKNKWPKTITLGTGEQFESITVVGINRDGVTIEEDGERTVKPITAVK